MIEMGLLVPSIYVDSFKTTLSNVYLAVAENDINIRTRKIDPYKGTWVTYNCSVWASKELRDKRIDGLITNISNTFPYDSSTDIVQQVYSNIKLMALDAEDC
jgi:hypothetical protein